MSPARNWPKRVFRKLPGSTRSYSMKPLAGKATPRIGSTAPSAPATETHYFEASFGTVIRFRSAIPV